jgi:hypothetical protein
VSGKVNVEQDLEEGSDKDVQGNTDTETDRPGVSKDLQGATVPLGRSSPRGLELHRGLDFTLAGTFALDTLRNYTAGLEVRGVHIRSGLSGQKESAVATRDETPGGFEQGNTVVTRTELLVLLELQELVCSPQNFLWEP